MTDTISIIENLFFQHHKMLCNIANNITNDKDVAKDIVQDVFLKMWKNRNEIEWNSSMKSYLYKATTNGALNWLEKNKKNVRYDNVQEFSIDIIDSEINTEEIKGKVERALNNLPPKCKAIFVLNRYEGLKYREIADHLDISIKTVENQMSIALKKLREELKPTFLNVVTTTIMLMIFFIV